MRIVLARDLDSYPVPSHEPERYPPPSAVQVEPCACGGVIWRYPEDTPAIAVTFHQATPEHAAWRYRREIIDGE